MRRRRLRRAAHLRPRPGRQPDRRPGQERGARCSNRRGGAQTWPSCRGLRATSEWLRYGWNTALGDRPQSHCSTDPPSPASARSSSPTPRTRRSGCGRPPTAFPRPPGPGVYNRSRLPGAQRLFPAAGLELHKAVEASELDPDPAEQEPWNHLEIQGAAFGPLTYAAKAGAPRARSKLADRPKGQERTPSTSSTRS